MSVGSRERREGMRTTGIALLVLGGVWAVAWLASAVAGLVAGR